MGRAGRARREADDLRKRIAIKLGGAGGAGGAGGGGGGVLVSNVAAIGFGDGGGSETGGVGGLGAALALVETALAEKSQVGLNDKSKP